MIGCLVLRISSGPMVGLRFCQRCEKQRHSYKGLWQAELAINTPIVTSRNCTFISNIELII